MEKIFENQMSVKRSVFKTEKELSDENKCKRNIGKMKFPYNLQPTDKHQRQSVTFFKELLAALMLMFSRDKKQA